MCQSFLSTLEFGQNLNQNQKIKRKDRDTENANAMEYITLTRFLLYYFLRQSLQSSQLTHLCSAASLAPRQYIAEQYPTASAYPHASLSQQQSLHPRHRSTNPCWWPTSPTQEGHPETLREPDQWWSPVVLGQSSRCLPCSWVSCHLGARESFWWPASGPGPEAGGEGGNRSQ